MERSQISWFRYEQPHSVHTIYEGQCSLRLFRYSRYDIPFFSQGQKNAPTTACRFHYVSIAAEQQDYSIRILHFPESEESLSSEMAKAVNLGALSSVNPNSSATVIKLLRIRLTQNGISSRFASRIMHISSQIPILL